MLSGAQFGAGVVAGSHSGSSGQASTPTAESNPVFNTR